MGKSLDLAKVSENMTPLERAKLIISIELRDIEKLISPDDPLSSEADIQKIAAACPTEQTNAYNNYIKLKNHVWLRLCPIVDLLLMQLDIYRNALSAINYQFLMSPFVYRALVWTKMVSGVIENEKNTDVVKTALNQIEMVLESMMPVDVNQTRMKGETYCISLRRDTTEEVFSLYFEKAKSVFQEIHDNLALVEAIQERHFEGMSLLSSDPGAPLGTGSRALRSIKEYIEKYNGMFDQTVTSFQEVNFEKSKVEFVKKEELLIADDIKVNQEWVEKRLKEIEEEHNA